jgi:hypothetical protein
MAHPEDFPAAAWAWTVLLTRAYGDRGCLDKVAGPRRGPTRAAGGGEPCARSFWWVQAWPWYSA